MTYYRLYCETHDEFFKPLAATEPGELLNPDYEQCRKNTTDFLAGQLRDFHAKHVHAWVPTGERIEGVPSLNGYRREGCRLKEVTIER